MRVEMAVKPRWRLATLVMGVLALAVCGSLSACGSNEDATSDDGPPGSSAKIGVLEQAQYVVFDQMVEGFRDGFAKTAKIPADKVSLDIKNAQGEASLVQTIARELPRGDFDQYVAIGTPAIVSLAREENEKPITAIAMTDPVGAGVAETTSHPGGNVTGSSDAVDPHVTASYLAQLDPRPKRVGTILDPSNEASQSFLNGIKPLLAAQGMELVEAPISGPGDVSAAALSLVGRVDTIALTADAIAAGAGLPAIASEAEAHKIPLVVAAGIDPSTPGVLAILSPDNHELGVLAGEDAGRIFRGEAEPATTPFVRIAPEVTVNEQTEREIGVTAPTDIESHQE